MDDNYKIVSLYGYGYESGYYMTEDDVIIRNGKITKPYTHSRSEYVRLKTIDGKWKTVCINTLHKKVFGVE